MKYFVGGEQTVFRAGERFAINFYFGIEMTLSGRIYGDAKDECYAAACAIVLWLNEMENRSKATAG